MRTFKQFLIESEKIEKLAKLLSVPASEVDKFGEKELQAILTNVGEHDFAPDSEFDSKELEMGIKVEKEHTKSMVIAKLIAKDHLKEDPKYYTKLKKVEGKH